MYGLWDITFQWDNDDDGGASSDSGGELGVDGSDFGDSRLRRLSEEVIRVYEFSYPCR